MQADSRMHRSALVALTVLLLPALAAADVVERTFDVADGGRLIVDTDLGSIDVRAGSSGEVRVRVEREARSGDDEDFELTFDQDGDTVRIEGDKPDSWGWSSWKHFRVHYSIEVPSGFSVDLDTSGGNIDVASLDGDVDCRTSGGNVSLEDVGGRVDCRTSGGDVSIGRVEGSVLAKTSGGNIKIDRSGGAVVAKTSGGNVYVDEVYGSVEATTSGGNVRVRMADQPTSDCRLTTSGGKIELAIDPSVAASIDASTSGGRVNVDFPVTLSGDVRRSRLEADLNGGGPQIYLRTSGGSIYVKEL